jgi:hypothetical protein
MKGEEKKENDSNDREMPPGRLCHPEESGGEGDVMAEQVNDCCSDQYDNDQKKEIGSEEREEWEGKDIKTEIVAEDGISLVERNSMTKEEIRLPSLCSVETKNEAEEATDPLSEAFHFCRPDRPVCNFDELAKDEGKTLRGETIGHKKVEIEDSGNQKANNTPQNDLRCQDRCKDRTETNFTEPEIVSIKTDGRTTQRKKKKTGDDE